MVKLVKLLEDRFKERIDGEEFASEDYEVSLLNFTKDGRRNLINLLKKLGLEEYLDMLKTVEGKTVKGYCFYDEEVSFINQLYDDYSGPLLAVRKNQLKDMEDEYAIKLYENILNLFTRRGFSAEQAYEKTKHTYNLLDYPIRKKQLAIDGLKNQIERITSLIMEERIVNITSRNDDFAWIDYVCNQMEERINGDIQLYYTMLDLRQSEINDCAEKYYENMSDEEREALWNDESYALIVHRAFNCNPRVQELQEKENEIKGISEDFNGLMNWQARNNYTLKEREELDKIHAEIRQLYRESAEKVKKERVKQKEFQPIFEKKVEYGFQGLKSSEQLLATALKVIEDENDCRQ